MESLKGSDSRKSTKSAEKAVTSHSKAKNSTVASMTGEKTDPIPGESPNNSSRMGYTKNSIELEMEYANTLEGQMNLFNLM